MPTTVAVLGARQLVRRGVESVLRESGNFDVIPGFTSMAELREWFAGPSSPVSARLDVLIVDLDRSMRARLLATGSGSIPVRRVVAVTAGGTEAGSPEPDVLSIDAIVAVDADPAVLLEVLAGGSGGFGGSGGLGGSSGSGGRNGPGAAACRGSASHPAVAGVPSTPLTTRESQVLHLIAEGLTTNDVSGHLGISPRTVANYKQHLFAKLGVQSRAHAVAVGSRLGLLAAGDPRSGGIAGAAGEPGVSRRPLVVGAAG